MHVCESNEEEVKIHLLDDLELKENAVTVTNLRLPIKKFKENEIIIHCTENKEGFLVANAVTTEMDLLWSTSSI